MVTVFSGTGGASRARPGEPRPAYDPPTTTLSERRAAKAAELAAMAPASSVPLPISPSSKGWGAGVVTLCIGVGQGRAHSRTRHPGKPHGSLPAGS